MRLRALHLRSFRNLSNLTFAPGAGVNVLTGANAQGKTNLLEAMYALAMAQSFRACRDTDMIRWEHGEAEVTGTIDCDTEGEMEVKLFLSGTEKKVARINGAKLTRITDMLARFKVVCFSAADLEIVGGDPAARRRYMNIAITLSDPGYVFDLARYKRALHQRNKLLRDLRDRRWPADDDCLDALSGPLIAHGARIIAKRASFVERLAPVARRRHADLTDSAQDLGVSYTAGVAPVDDHPDPVAAIAEAFRLALTRHAPDELRRGITLTGPHRDDLALSIDGQDARAFGSQGQQRTIALALKLAEFQLVEETAGESPVMLLDDVMSDLDDLRRERLLDWADGKCQTFVTCTATRSFGYSRLARASLFRVAGGTVTAESTSAHRKRVSTRAKAPAA